MHICCIANLLRTKSRSASRKRRRPRRLNARRRRRSSRRRRPNARPSGRRSRRRKRECPPCEYMLTLSEKAREEKKKADARDKQRALFGNFFAAKQAKQAAKAGSSSKPEPVAQASRKWFCMTKTNHQRPKPKMTAEVTLRRLSSRLRNGPLCGGCLSTALTSPSLRTRRRNR